MNTIAAAVKRYPLTTFFVLAYAFSWTMIALIPVSFAFALLGLFGPAVAAVVVLAITEGRTGVGGLLRKLLLWRVGVRWYIVALGLPFLLALMVVALHVLLGGQWTLQAGNSPTLMLILALMVVGEELGWRGFALPRLQVRYSGLVASLILGVLWAAWHLMNATIPGQERYLTAFVPFLLWVVAQTILFTWIANHTLGSVLIAWLFHAAINVSSGIFFLPDTVLQWWLSAAVYGAAAVIVVLVQGPDLSRERAIAATAQTEPV